MGHYVLARWHGVDTSLPYFIPLPYLGVGTLGAVIRIRSRIPTRNALVDIGAAGPLAGVAVALPRAALGPGALAPHGRARPCTTRFRADTSLWDLGQDLFLWAREKLALAPPASEAPQFVHQAIVFSDSLLMRALKWLVLGPLAGGQGHPGAPGGHRRAGSACW